MTPDKTILLTIDVEDWFHVENFRPWIPFETWDQRELRVERNTHRLLDLFDSIELKTHTSKLVGQNEKSHPKATFFTLGWIAERLPHLVKEIRNRGHEVASHGYNHNLCTQLPVDELRKDLIDSKKCLEDILGEPIRGFRAPNFSISSEILKIIEDCGYKYDSSFNSFALNRNYGSIALNGHRPNGIAYRMSQNFFELPISNLNRLGKVIPLGGGAYFRLIPFPLFKLGIEQVLKDQKAYLFYMHPWEIDTEQPRIIKTSAFARFKHYTNIDINERKLRNCLQVFSNSNFMSCDGYLSAIT